MLLPIYNEEYTTKITIPEHFQLKFIRRKNKSILLNSAKWVGENDSQLNCLNEPITAFESSDPKRDCKSSVNRSR